MPFGATFYEEANILCRKCIILMRTIYMQEQVAKLDILIKAVAAAPPAKTKTVIGRAGPVKGRAPLRGAGINYRGGTCFTAHRSRSAE